MQHGGCLESGCSLTCVTMLTSRCLVGAVPRTLKLLKVWDCCRTLEAALSMRLQDWAENRSITSVIPLDTSAASADFLLDMSPEQAEATELCALSGIGAANSSSCCMRWAIWAWCGWDRL